MRLALIPAVLALAAASCTHTPSTPYTPMDGAQRNTAQADALNQQAVDLMAPDPAKAEKLLREALAADLYHGPAHNNLGVLFLQQGKLYEAAGEFECGPEFLPGHPDPRLNLSLTLESAGRYDQALDHARTALQIHPGHIASIQQLARLEVLHPPAKDQPSNREDLRDRLREIALRGESPAWQDWARGQLVRLDGELNRVR